jgi:hypothetical protein
MVLPWLALLLATAGAACDSEESTRPTAPQPSEATEPGGGTPVGERPPPSRERELLPASAADASSFDLSDELAGGPLAHGSAAESERPLLESGPRPLEAELVERLLARQRQPLAIGHLLSRGEVREVTGYAARLTEAPLSGQTPDDHYNGLRLATDDGYGVGLQVWRFGDATRASSHFERLRQTYIVNGSTRVAGDQAFRSEFGGIRQLVFQGRASHTVVAVSCDVTVCTDDQVLQDLAQRVHGRL